MIDTPLNASLTVFIGTAAVLCVFACLLHLLPRLGGLGRWLADRTVEAPLLDLVVFVFTVLPQLVAVVAAVMYVGWMAPAIDVLMIAAWWFVMAVAGQCLALMLWTVAHEAWHRASPKGQLRKLAKEERIVWQINRAVGRTWNHTAVWWTALAVPVFAIVRVAELVIYPPLTWMIRLPRYRQADWVNVSRHKFDGLVGHDRIWCLYCDWMTGVWSMGSEMLRNIESFWCPVRFNSAAKCETCALDFPDVNGGWVREEDGGMPAVAKKVGEMYPGPSDPAEPGDQPVNAWFGHPVRLTVKQSEEDR